MDFRVYERLQGGDGALSLVGLGYVGLPIAVAFARSVRVIGFDVNQEKVDLYKRGVDPTCEVGDETVASTKVEFTSDPARLREASILSQCRPPSLTTTALIFAPSSRQAGCWGGTSVRGA